MAAAAASHQSDNNGNNNQNGGRNAEARSQRTEQRQADSQPQAQPQPQPQVQVVERRGNDGGGNNNGGNRNWRGNNDGNRGTSGDGSVRVRRERNNPGSIYPQAWQGDPNDPRLRHYQDLERRNQQGGNDRGNWRNDRNDRNDRNWRGDRNDRNGRNTRNWRNDWNRGWRNDNRYNWNNWRYRNRNVFHLSPYYSPYRDWRYQRFSIGFFLEPLFFDQRYWIDDPWQYRLPEAPDGTEWVRYYNDVVLVDI